MRDRLRSSRQFGWTAVAVCIGLLLLTLLMRDGPLRWLAIGAIAALFYVAIWRLPRREPPGR